MSITVQLYLNITTERSIINISPFSLQEILLPENSHLLERSFTVRFRCLLDNTSGFLVSLKVTKYIQTIIKLFHIFSASIFEEKSNLCTAKTGKPKSLPSHYSVSVRPSDPQAYWRCLRKRRFSSPNTNLISVLSLSTREARKSSASTMWSFLVEESMILSITMT